MNGPWNNNNNNNNNDNDAIARLYRIVDGLAYDVESINIKIQQVQTLTVTHNRENAALMQQLQKQNSELQNQNSELLKHNHLLSEQNNRLTWQNKAIDADLKSMEQKFALLSGPRELLESSIDLACMVNLVENKIVAGALNAKDLFSSLGDLILVVNTPCSPHGTERHQRKQAILQLVALAQQKHPWVHNLDIIHSRFQESRCFLTKKDIPLSPTDPTRAKTSLLSLLDSIDIPQQELKLLLDYIKQQLT